jgi:hypothetical protein
LTQTIFPPQLGRTLREPRQSTARATMSAAPNANLLKPVQVPLDYSYPALLPIHFSQACCLEAFEASYPILALEGFSRVITCIPVQWKQAAQERRDDLVRSSASAEIFKDPRYKNVAAPCWLPEYFDYCSVNRTSLLFFNLLP